MHSAAEPNRADVNAAEGSQCPCEAARTHHLLEEAMAGLAEDCMNLPLKILISLPF